MAIWSTFNSVADFAGRVNNVDGFISNVKKWIGIGSETPEPARSSQVFKRPRVENSLVYDWSYFHFASCLLAFPGFSNDDSTSFEFQ